VRALKLLAALLAAVLLHVAGVHLWPSFPRSVDLLLVVVVLNALDGDSFAGLAGGLLAGLVHDALTGGLYGLYGFADTLVGYLTARAGQRLVIQRAAGVMVVVLLATLAQQGILALLVALLFSDQSAMPDLPALSWVVIKAVVDGLVGWALYVGSGRFGRLREARRRSRLSKLR
jgi:rod shape-determining protein MreD